MTPVVALVGFYLLGGFGALAAASEPGTAIMAWLLAALDPTTVPMTIPLAALLVGFARGAARGPAGMSLPGARHETVLGALALGLVAAALCHATMDPSVVAYNEARATAFQAQRGFGPHDWALAPGHAALTSAELEVRLARASSARPAGADVALARHLRHAVPVLGVVAAPLGVVLGLGWAAHRRQRAQAWPCGSTYALAAIEGLRLAGLAMAATLGPVAAAWLPVAGAALLAAVLAARLPRTRSRHEARIIRSYPGPSGHLRMATLR